MTEVAVVPIETHRRFYPKWVAAILFTPRQAFSQITATATGSWVMPLLILSLTAFLSVMVAGPIQKAAALNNPVEFPPDYQYWSPEQQAQFQKANEARSGNTFIYVLPALAALTKVWVSWLLFGGLLHLVSTLFGGRGDTGTSMNVVAWSSLPFALRDLVRTGAMLVTHKLIANPGLSGFASPAESGWPVFLKAILGQIDIYQIWFVLLLFLGIRAGTGVPRGKAVSIVFVTVLLILGLQALIAYGLNSLSSLNIIRPFLF